jgi:hypothetical protein
MYMQFSGYPANEPLPICLLAIERLILPRQASGKFLPPAGPSIPGRHKFMRLSHLFAVRIPHNVGGEICTRFRPF